METVSDFTASYWVQRACGVGDMSASCLGVQYHHLYRLQVPPSYGPFYVTAMELRYDPIT